MAMIKKLGMYTAHNLSFDDELHGEFVGVKYTHHEAVKFDGTIGEPLYLALDLRENDAGGNPGKAIGFYLVGSANATAWIKEVDERIQKMAKLERDLLEAQDRIADLEGGIQEMREINDLES